MCGEGTCFTEINGKAFGFFLVIAFFKMKNELEEMKRKSKTFYMIIRYWTTFETLPEIERDCKERQLNYAW